MDSDVQSVWIPWKTIPKARPKFNSDTKRAYMPKEYAEWKEQVAEFLGYQLPFIEGNIALFLSFNKAGVRMEIWNVERERFGSADLDNLAGAVMDALQDSGVISNDKQVVMLTAGFANPEVP